MGDMDSGNEALRRSDGSRSEPTWRLLRSGPCSPSWNMAVDEAVMTAHGEGKAPPTVRFYGWNPASLSIGYFQKAEEEVDLDAVQTEGVGFVRRPTGGRAVLHDRELTYSIIVSEEYPGLPRSVTESYRVLSEGLLCGFRNLGLRADMVSLSSPGEKAKYASMGSAACFDSPSWYELVVEGRKVAGSAQTRQKGVLLQHGSILLELDAERLFRLLRFHTEKLRKRLYDSFADKAAAINDILTAEGRRPVGLKEVESAFVQGMAEGLGARLVEEGLTPYELELAGELEKDKYASEAWNRRK